MPDKVARTTVAELAAAAEAAARRFEGTPGGSGASAAPAVPTTAAVSPTLTGADTGGAPADDLLAEGTLVFVRAFDAWARRTALAAGGDSLARLRLLHILSIAGPQKMADLAAHLEVTPRNITTLVDALEGAGQVRRTSHPSDRRVTMIELGDASGAVDDQMAVLRASVSDLFAEVDPADVAAFERVLATVLPRLAPGG